ncbi:hypothetical protein Acr_05g0003980 [Actinidia rufa]|uniref:Uncharacterized protein n=1 Tax=Actinidia rufa TaxID=165716 RepID=A0A7J0ELF0_9ERIC|nr:hypothetical protein Acr_05g0003980 [Actinidia rufa]
MATSKLNADGTRDREQEIDIIYKFEKRDCCCDDAESIPIPKSLLLLLLVGNAAIALILGLVLVVMLLPLPSDSTVAADVISRYFCCDRYTVCFFRSWFDPAHIPSKLSSETSWFSPLLLCSTP